MRSPAISRLVAAAAAAAALSLAACAPNRGAEYAASVAAARRAQAAGRYAEAAERLGVAATQAKLPRDAVFARYESALLRAKSGDVARASRELRAIADMKPPSDYSAIAAFKAAGLRAETDPDGAMRELEAIALRWPKAGIARVALVRVLRHDDEASGDAGALRHADALLTKLRGTELEQIVLYERARRLDALGRTADALAAYLALADAFPYPFGVHWDDALFRASVDEEKLGRPREAIAHLERMLRERESAHFMGTYERPQYSPALRRIAELYERALHDRAAAREAHHRFYRELTTSPLRDDALWHEARLFREDGDTSGSCARLGTLASEFPDSRYVPCATAMCPDVKRPSKSHAPTECRAYIMRGERGTEPGAD
jgi:tetratricopeptide (TPR) repeat protein